jgi:H+/Cl- antiporter ClcA
MSVTTAIVFAVEALSGYDNILYVILAAATAFVVTELFGVNSITDSVLEHRVASDGQPHFGKCRHEA